MLRLLVGLTLSVFLLLGCSQSATVHVTGTVTLDGQPSENVEVMFWPKQGRLTTGVTDSAGHFSLSTFKHGDGAVPGDHSVTLGEYYPPGKAPTLPRGGGPLPSRFPDQYGDRTQTPLTLHVELGGRNDFSLEVKKE